jgi:hypothetical protein
MYEETGIRPPINDADAAPGAPLPAAPVAAKGGK